MASDPALVAHVLRRCTFGPRPGQVEALLARAGSVAGAIDSVLGGAAIEAAPPEFGTDDDRTVLRRWWLARIADPAAGLHEKMVWFWHGHLTSGFDKVGEPQLMWRQHQLLREHALGDARALLQAITVDGAMLRWLDGDPSTSEAPNENYGRELMELFALGRGNYTQADVKAAAYALAGWNVDGDSESEHHNEVRFDAEQGPQHAVSFLGRDVKSAADVVNAVCDHPACAPYLAGMVHRYLAGADPSDARRAELAGVFRDAGLQVRPLVEAIVRHPSFLELRLNRPRFPIEWWPVASAVLGTWLDDDALWHLGQVPFEPPNVAGWPVSPRWLSAAAALERAHRAWDFASDTEVPAATSPEAEVDAVLVKAGLYEVSATTRAALTDAARRIDGRRDRASVLHALVVASPEFAVA